MKSGFVNAKGIFGWTKFLTYIALVPGTFHMLSLNMISNSLSFVGLITTQPTRKPNILHFNVTVQILLQNAFSNRQNKT